MIAKRPHQSTNNLHAARFQVVLLSFFCVLLSVGFKEVRAASWDGTCQGPSCPIKTCGTTECKNGGYCDPDSPTCLCPPDYGQSDCGVKVNACPGGSSATTMVYAQFRVQVQAAVVTHTLRETSVERKYKISKIAMVATIIA